VAPVPAAPAACPARIFQGASPATTTEEPTCWLVGSRY
jgi:hypothetical protein